MIKKKLHKLFKIYGLTITMLNEYAKNSFLDTHLNLVSGVHEPYMKPNSILSYINANSNHSPSVKKSLIKNITCRISELSAKKEIFDWHIDRYKQALVREGYVVDRNIKYIPKDSEGRGYTIKYTNKRVTNVKI